MSNLTLLPLKFHYNFCKNANYFSNIENTNFITKIKNTNEPNQQETSRC